MSSGLFYTAIDDGDFDPMREVSQSFGCRYGGPMAELDRDEALTALAHRAETAVAIPHSLGQEGSHA